MALNFRVCAKGGGNRSTTLQLAGDFDASSACELINILDESIKKSRTVAIDTDGLKTVHDFGIALFLPRLARLSRSRATIQVTGRYSDLFSET